MPALNHSSTITFATHERDFTKLRVGVRLLASVFLLKILLDIGYVSFVSKVFAYQGFSFKFDFLRYSESLTLTGLLGLVLPKTIARPSDFFIIILATGLIIPMLSLAGLSEQSNFALYCVLGCFVFINLFRRGPPLKIKKIKQGKMLFNICSWLVVFSVLFWLLALGNLSNFNLKLSNVYEFRGNSASDANVGMFSYINVWATKVIGPVLLAYFFWRKNNLGIILIFLLHVFWFGMLHHKAVLFYPLLVLFTCYWLSLSAASHYFLLALCGVLFASIATFLILNDIFISSLFIRRTFFSGAINTFEYYEFFRDNVKIYWSNSSLSLGLIEYPYHLRPGELIGEYRGLGSNANNSFLSTGYMHAGIIGLALYSVLAAFLFRLIDSLAIDGLPIWLQLAPFVVSIRALLLSTDLPTAILSHGVGFAIILAIAARSFDLGQKSPEVKI